MKQFVVVAVLCVLATVQALTDEQKAKVKANSEKCVTQTGVDPALVAKGRKGEFSDDPKLVAFIYCFLQASEIVDKNGDPIVDKIKQKLGSDVTEKEIDELLAKCKFTDPSPAKKSAQFYKCYYANSSKQIELA